MASTPPTAPLLDNTFGAVYIGFVISLTIFGIFTSQVYRYYTRYTTDSVIFKSAVGFLWFLMLLDSVLLTHAVYHYLISSFGNYELLDHIVWSLRAEAVVTSVIFLIAQTLYAIRLWWFHRSLPSSQQWRWVPYAMGLAMLAAYAGFFLETTLVAPISRFSTFAARIQPAVYLPLGIATVVDLGIMFCVVSYIGHDGRAFRDGGFATKLVVYTIATGFFTSLCSIIDIIVYLAMPHNLIFVGTQMVLAELYGVSLLTMLNMRRSAEAGATVSVYQPRRMEITVRTTASRERSPSASFDGNRLSTLPEKEECEAEEV